MNGELELDWKLRLGKLEEDGPTIGVRKLDTKSNGLPSANQPCQGKV